MYIEFLNFVNAKITHTLSPICQRHLPKLKIKYYFTVDRNKTNKMAAGPIERYLTKMTQSFMFIHLYTTNDMNSIFNSINDYAMGTYVH